MGSPTCLTDPELPIAADTSAVINLNATGCAATILAVIPNRVLVVDIVRGELDDGRARGRTDADRLNALVGEGLVEVVTLGEAALSNFEKLVVGPAAKTLDDGEAATIAFAAAHGAVARIDERKGTRLSSELFPAMPIACTGDILAHPEVLRRLGKEALADAVFNALDQGHMRVFPRHLDWVVELIGPARAGRCRSLRTSTRQAALRAAGTKRSSR